MKLFNDRYSVIRTISEGICRSSYLVNDMDNSLKPVCLNVIRYDKCDVNGNESMRCLFLKFKGVNNSKIINLKEMGIITSIDDKPAVENFLFYTTEYINSEYNFEEAIENFDFDKKLDLFAEICMAVNMLNLMGIDYGGIEADNIFIDGNSHIKLQDLLTAYIKRRNDFKVNQEAARDSILPESDIYSMGKLIIDIFGIDSQNISDKNISVLSSLADEMICENMQTSCLTFVIKEINRLFNKNYPAFKIEEIDKLNFNFELLHRNDQKMKVIRAYQEIESNKGSFKILGIHGDLGIGKTTFLKEINFNFQILKIKVIDNLDIKETLQYKWKKQDFTSRLKEFSGSHNGKDAAVVIVDDMGFKDRDILEFMDDLANGKIKNVLFIFSYNDYENKYPIMTIIKNAMNKHSYQDERLNQFDEKETHEIVKKILGMNYSVPKFSKLIYKKSSGNPLLIEEIIRSLYAQKQIRRDGTTGQWGTGYKYKELSIPSDLEHLFVNQLCKLDERSKEVLAVISAFKRHVYLSEISQVLECEEEEMEPVVANLEKTGIISRILNKRDNIIVFSNKLMKIFVYNNFSEDNKKKLNYKVTMFMNKKAHHPEEAVIQELRAII